MITTLKNANRAKNSDEFAVVARGIDQGAMIGDREMMAIMTENSSELNNHRLC